MGRGSRLGWVFVLLGACRWGFDDLPASGDASTDATTGGTSTLCTDTWCWERAPAIEQRSLRAIRGSSATDVWAVGDGGTIRHWDGTAWSTVPSPSNEAFVAIDVRSPSDVTLAGGAGHLWHYDGTTWTMSTTPGGRSVAALWRAPDTTLWGAGEIGSIVINGSAGPQVGNGTSATALHGTSTTNIWHAGVFNTVAYWGGVAWTTTTVSDYINAVWTLPTGAAWAAGAQIWSCTTTPSCTSAFSGANALAIYGFAGNDIWTVGAGGTIAHYNGSAWQLVTSPTTLPLTALWGASATDVWAVGEYGAIVHYDGASWSNVGTTSFSETGYATVWVGADNDRWMVGPAGTLLHSDGGTPVAVALPAGAVAGDEIRGAAGNDLYATDVGMGRVLHFDGTSWSVDMTTNGAPMGLLSNTVETIASTITGYIYTKPAGGAWSQSFLSAGEEFHGLCRTSDGDVAAVARFGDAALRTNGSWARNDPPTGRFLLACATRSDFMYAVGGDAVVMYNGASWSSIGTSTYGLAQSLQDALVVNGDLYLTGTHGKLVRYDGITWREEALPVGFAIMRLVRSSTGTIYAVGYGPGMLRRR